MCDLVGSSKNSFFSKPSVVCLVIYGSVKEVKQKKEERRKVMCATITYFLKLSTAEQIFINID